MSLANDHQLAATIKKLAALDEQIAAAKRRSATAENTESLDSLCRMADQLRAEITHYRSRPKRQAS